MRRYGGAHWTRDAFVLRVWVHHFGVSDNLGLSNAISHHLGLSSCFLLYDVRIVVALPVLPLATNPTIARGAIIHSSGWCG